MQVPFYLSAFNTTDYAVQHSLGIQEAARQLRYNWFNTLLKTEAYSYVLTAHHANDNVETVLMHLFRGSGIKGLRGMLPKQGQVLRPLLHASRAQIEAYAAQLQLSWVEDSSNATDHYTRNLVRHKVVDAMIEVYPKAMENFNHSVHLLRQAAGVYSTTVETLLKKLVVIKAEEHHLPILLLKKMPEPEAILYEWLQPHGFLASQMAQAWQLLDAQSGTTLLSPTHRIIKHRAWIILAPLAPMQSQHLVINNFDSPILFQSQQLLGRFQTGNDTSILPNKNMAFFDAS
ncbi:MAG: tRNA lysidine(34) synthetase TilS, partial [Bacteroidetes bacterium]